jgi:exonuclease VII small subunit
MPTPESAEAFDKLTTARNRLLEVTKQLNDAGSASPNGFLADAANYRHLQEGWKEAFHEFEAATQELAAIVKRLREKEHSK